MNMKNGKPSTAFLHYSAPPVIGGVEAVIQAHSQVFRKNDFPVAVIAGRGDDAALAQGTVFHQIPEMDTQNEKVLEINYSLEKGAIPDSFETFKNQLYEALEGILVNYENVIVHNILTKHFNIPLTAALLQLVDDGTIQNCIGWCHDFSWTSPNSRSKVHEGHPWDLLRRYNPKIKYVTVSQERQKTLAQLYNQPEEMISVIYNGVDPQNVLGFSQEGKALIDRLSLLDCELVLLMPVRVTKAKNIEYAMELLVELKTKGILPKLIVTGPPDPHSETIMDYYRTIQQRRQELDLVNEMRFVYESGPQSEVPYEIEMDVVGDLYRVSDIMLMPSHREGFGMPILEAGLVGIPAICTDKVPVAVEIGGDDVIVFNGDEAPVSLAHKIVKWTQTNPQHHFRKLIRTKYTWRAIFEQEILPILIDP